MAVYTYGLVNTDVYPYLAFNTSNIGANSDVTPAMITQFIEDASGEITGALRNAGIANESLSDDQLAAVRRAIAQYAAYQCYQAIGWLGQGAQRALDDYNAVLQRYQSMPQALGASGPQVKSNVNTTTPRARQFGRTYEW